MNSVEYEALSFNRVFGELVPTPNLSSPMAPMKDLSAEDQKEAWHAGEQVEIGERDE